MTPLLTLDFSSWSPACSAEDKERAIDTLEDGGVLLLPHLDFSLAEDEKQFLSPAIAGQSKNISLNPATRTLQGSSAEGDEIAKLQRMVERYADSAASLVHALLPHYDGALNAGRTSYRPTAVEGRQNSWRKDDSRLHVDSFPSSPLQGKRILRVFTNVNPEGKSRSWRLGEPFEDVAKRFLPAIPKPIWGSSSLLNLLGITKSKRSAYDHYMLRLHDQMKFDLAYQKSAPQSHHEFQPGCTWVVFSDQASHAAMGGQYMFEQTFYLPADAMKQVEKAPLRVLERLLQRSLI